MFPDGRGGSVYIRALSWSQSPQVSALVEKECLAALVPVRPSLNLTPYCHPVAKQPYGTIDSSGTQEHALLLPLLHGFFDSFVILFYTANKKICFYDPGRKVWGKSIGKKTEIKHIRHVFIVPFNPKAQKHMCNSIFIIENISCIC